MESSSSYHFNLVVTFSVSDSRTSSHYVTPDEMQCELQRVLYAVFMLAMTCNLNLVKPLKLQLSGNTWMKGTR